MYVPTSTTPPPSAQARELGDRLSEVARSYVADHPGMAHIEVSQAFGLAKAQLAMEMGGAGEKVRVLAAVMIGLVVAAGLGAALFAGADLGASPQAIIALMVGVIGIGAVVVALASKGGGAADRQRTLIMVAIGLVLMGLLAFLLMARGGGSPLG